MKKLVSAAILIALLPFSASGQAAPGSNSKEESKQIIINSKPPLPDGGCIYKDIIYSNGSVVKQDNTYNYTCDKGTWKYIR